MGIFGNLFNSTKTKANAIKVNSTGSAAKQQAIARVQHIDATLAQKGLDFKKTDELKLERIHLAYHLSLQGVIV